MSIKNLHHYIGNKTFKLDKTGMIHAPSTVFWTDIRRGSQCACVPEMQTLSLLFLCKRLFTLFRCLINDCVTVCAMVLIVDRRCLFHDARSNDQLSKNIQCTSLHW